MALARAPDALYSAVSVSRSSSIRSASTVVRLPGYRTATVEGGSPSPARGDRTVRTTPPAPITTPVRSRSFLFGVMTVTTVGRTALATFCTAASAVASSPADARAANRQRTSGFLTPGFPPLR
jgi:hypothetical protein